MTYARLLEMFSRSKRVQEQGSSSSGADVASIPARLCEILTGFSKGATRVISRLNARPGYKGGGQSIRATKTKLAQINPGHSTNCWLKWRRHRSLTLEVIQVRSLSDPNLYLVPGMAQMALATAEISKTSTLSDSVKNRYFRTVFFLKHIVMS